MEDYVEIYIPGRPQSKQRPMYSHKTGKFFTPKQTVVYEQFVSEVAAEKIKKPFEGKISVQIFIHLTENSRKPDIDNVIKSVLDGMSKVVYNDDAQVVELYAKMEDVKYKEKQGVLVRVKEV